MTLALPSYAKINLFLHILDKREDGFHALRSLMLPISLADTLQFESLKTPHIEIECSDPSLPTDKTNLVRKAANFRVQFSRNRIRAINRIWQTTNFRIKLR